MDLIWIHRIEEYPKKIRDILIHGTGGTRGEGALQRTAGRGCLSDIAFEGLIQERGAPLPGDRIRDNEGRNMRPLCGSRLVRACQGQRLKTDLSGSDHWREEYL